ncbi:glycosyltransferase family 2 protein [Candidatus Saganbacteria bacterium]|nr:glycosyltransferase family 2 protein [Candidatus Saganbacteria bacterium]
MSFLQEAIASIISQIEDVSSNELEIVISDNASTDQTEKIAAQIKKKNDRIIEYFKNEKNVGFDGNCLLSVERARGEFVWLLGDDDLLSPGALKYVLQKLKQDKLADLYFFEKKDFMLTPDQPMRPRRIMPFNEERIYNFQDKKVTDNYFRTNKKLIAYCNYLSNVVFRREKWLKVAAKERFVGTGYVHLYAFQSMLWGRAPGTMGYWPEPLVKRRWGNDGSVEPEMRLRQDVLMFHKIAAAVFFDKKYIYLIDDLVIRNDGFSWAVRLKLADPKRFILIVIPFLFGAYWNHLLFWAKLFPLIIMPNFLLRFMRGFYRRQVKGEPLSFTEIFAG